jgi:hypothetical protein
MFLELWSDHPDGFPQPKGCYIWTDRTDPKLPDGKIEAYIVFSEKNGLSAETKYQVT